MNTFQNLVLSISELHYHLQAEAFRAVNQSLTIRNWVIGMYIVEFEQNGSDRAQYGDQILANLATEIKIKGLTHPELSRCRQFYQCYPHFIGSLRKKFTKMLPASILGSVTQEFQSTEDEDSKLLVPAEKLLSKLSYTHLVELIKIDEELKRTFYEIECIKGTWSVRELKRQINSLYFERSGLSNNPELLSERMQSQVNPEKATDIIKNLYTFDFLDFRGVDFWQESDLESALLDHLQAFILELGNGFCLEARQKRILIGDTYYFIDLLFYHRILKCHVLIELKVGAFTHEDIGQLNTYLNYFKAEVTEAGDNPPVGILMVAEKNHALVKYATAGMDKNLFVQQYMLKLPSKEDLRRFIEVELEKLN